MLPRKDGGHTTNKKEFVVDYGASDGKLSVPNILQFEILVFRVILFYFNSMNNSRMVMIYENTNSHPINLRKRFR